MVDESWLVKIPMKFLESKSKNTLKTYPYAAPGYFVACNHNLVRKKFWCLNYLCYQFQFPEVKFA